MNHAVLIAFLATLFTWSMTALGAAVVIFFRTTSEKVMNLLLGFAAGVMIAASFWSLLQPAIEQAEATSACPAFLVVSLGFVFGALFMWGSDKAVTAARRRLSVGDGGSERLNRMILLVLSITLHNIPEGLAIGVAFGALSGNGGTGEALMGAVSIAVGIGLQNFPEGAAVSLPLRREGMSRRRAFFLGQASGIVEPIAGVLGALAVVYIRPLLPVALSFAAGAMILVAVHELIPECQENRDADPYLATMGIVAGFTVMMLLDVALG